MNTAFELAGVALAALLSENMVLVSSMGVGTDRRAFQDPPPGPGPGRLPDPW